VHSSYTGNYRAIKIFLIIKNENDKWGEAKWHGIGMPLSK